MQRGIDIDPPLLRVKCCGDMDGEDFIKSLIDIQMTARVVLDREEADSRDGNLPCSNIPDWIEFSHPVQRAAEI